MKRDALAMWEIRGNFWLPDNLLEDAIAADITRGILLYSQANYFGARTCFQLAAARLNPDPLGKNFITQIKQSKVPSWVEIRDYLLGAVPTLRDLKDQHGVLRIGKARDVTVEGIQLYADTIERAAYLRNAICHGVLTKDDEGELVLHPTSGGAVVLWKEVEEFVVLCANAYSVTSVMPLNLVTIEMATGTLEERWPIEDAE